MGQDGSDKRHTVSFYSTKLDTMGLWRRLRFCTRWFHSLLQKGCGR